MSFCESTAPMKLPGRAQQGHVAVTPGEANETRRGATGEFGRTGGVKRGRAATRPRRIPPRGAPWTGLPRAERPPLPSLLAPRRLTGRRTAGPRRRCDLGRSPPPRSSVGGRYSARLSRYPAACPSESCSQVLGAHVSNACGTTGDPPGPPAAARALSRPNRTVAPTLE